LLAVMPCQLKLHAVLINSSSLVNDASVSPADSSLTSHSIAACINQYRVRSVCPSLLGSVRSNSYSLELKGKGSPYSISERRVPELIPVLGSQPAGDVSHKPGGRLQLLSAAQACIYRRNP